MRRPHAAAVSGGVLGILAMVLFGWTVLGSTVVDAPAPPPQMPAPRALVSPPPVFDEVLDPLDPDLLREAIRGDLGVKMVNRVCALCADGTLDDAACGRCGTDGPRARVHVDLIDEDGRALEGWDTTAMVFCEVSGGQTGRSLNEKGFADVPTGDCVVKTTRNDGPFQIETDSVPMQLEPGEEVDLMVEVPTVPWGGVGVTLADLGHAVVIEHVLPGSAADGQVVPGSLVVGIDGAAPGELATTVSGVAQAITGPAGSYVELTVYPPSIEVQEPYTVELERRSYKASELALGWGPPA